MDQLAVLTRPYTPTEAGYRIELSTSELVLFSYPQRSDLTILNRSDKI